jgi:hypothetical protein
VQPQRPIFDFREGLFGRRDPAGCDRTHRAAAQQFALEKFPGGPARIALEKGGELFRFFDKRERTATSWAVHSAPSFGSFTVKNTR